MTTPFENIPNGKSSQVYYCMESYVARHIAGVKYKKCDEFRAFPGITSIKSIDVPYNKINKIYHKFVINGKPASVDNVILKMNELINSLSANIKWNSMDEIQSQSIAQAMGGICGEPHEIKLDEQIIETDVDPESYQRNLFFSIFGPIPF